MHLARLGLLALVALPLLAPTRAADATTAERADRASDLRAGGRLFAVESGDADLVADLWAVLPLRKIGAGTGFLHLDNRLTMEMPDRDFTFLVQDLQYGARLGWSVRPRWTGHREISTFLARRGKLQVDAEGDAWVPYLGLGLAGSGFTLHAGPALSEHGVRADLVVAGGARVPLFRGRRALLGLDVDLDSLVDGGDAQTEIAAGPRLAFPLASGIAATIQVRYSHGRNPLGLEGDRWLLGFSYERTSEENAPPPTQSGPAIDGRIAAGAGDGRESGQLLLRFRSPDLFHATRLVFALDGNLLTAEDTDDLYYRYQLGLERPLEGGTVSLDFYHRSNHRLHAAGDGVTSINVVEGGIETSGWLRPSGWGPRPPRGLDATAHIGYLLDGSFGTERRWHVRAGLRWLPLAARPLYLRADAEAGEVQGQTVAVGVGIGRRLDLEIGYRNDDQLYSEDDTAVQATASYGF